MHKKKKLRAVMVTRRRLMNQLLYRMMRLEESLK
jgi:hypothetical protein